MYNELIEALDLAGKNDSVITVLTGTVSNIQGHFILSAPDVFISLVISRQEAVTSTAVAMIWTTSLKSQKVVLRRWLRMLESCSGQRRTFLWVLNLQSVLVCVNDICCVPNKQGIREGLHWLPEASDRCCKRTSCGNFCHRPRPLWRRVRYTKCELAFMCYLTQP